MTMSPKDMEGLQPRLREVLEKISSEAGGGVAWDDITNKPTELPPEAHTHPTSDVTGLGALATEDSVAWDDVTDKPSTFMPEAHNHNASDITEGVLDAARIPTLAQSKITNL